MTRYVWRNGCYRDPKTNEPMPLPEGEVVCAPMIQSDYPAYYSHGSGRMIEGRRARRDDLARTNCRELDSSEGPKTVRSEKAAKQLGLEHDPNAGRPKHWADWQSSKRIES